MVGIKDLETITYAKIYTVKETEVLMQHDSPVPGCTDDIEVKTFDYRHFSSEERANEFIGQRRVEHQRINNSLQSKDNHPYSGSRFCLVGVTNHPWAHEYRIEHNVMKTEVPVDELTTELTDLVNNPKKVLAYDKSRQ